MTEFKTLCILPKIEGLGGPASFQARLAAGLRARGVDVHHNPHRRDTDVILLIGGISRLDLLWAAKRRGVRIVQRLNGMNWIHKKKKVPLQLYLKAEWNNWVLSTIRKQIADQIVYQSQFARSWWQTTYGKSGKPDTVIFNGVDLQVFTPDGDHERPEDHARLLLVEGRLGGGAEAGLENGVALARQLSAEWTTPVELMVVGQVPPALRQQVERQSPDVWINWAGVAKRTDVPRIDRSAHVLFSADLNAACPNSVIEALACGLPVVSYATGSLPELITEEAGQVVPYGSNYWNLEAPQVGALASAARSILSDQECFRRGARARAEESFGVEQMVEEYSKVLVIPDK
jgi:glycosyltransferase involved in cell wall biosynthesis